MHRKLLIVSMSVVVCASLLVMNMEAVLPSPPTVVVTVQVQDTSGGTLSYKWKSSDGTIQSVNAASTTWTLPRGPGLHFAYVLIDNGLGGVSEARVAVNTDTIGVPPKAPPKVTMAAPPAPAQQGDFYRAFLPWSGTSINTFFHDTYSPGLAAYVQDTVLGTRYPAATNVVSNARGEVAIPGVPPGTNYALNCSTDGGQTFEDCTANAGNEMLAEATSAYILGGPNAPAYSGSFFLADGTTPCGTQNEFFGIHTSATVTSLDKSRKAIGAPVTVNELGQYSVPYNANTAWVSLKCGKAKAVVVPVVNNPNGADLGTTTLARVTAPTIQTMTATLNGTSVGLFLPAPSGLPSDVLKRSDAYLAEKGLDTRIGACQYYKAVGAVKGCTPAGGMQGAISFEDWKRTVQIDKYATGAVPQYSATYINQMDLNLARVHNSISYGPNQTAAYVCNHLGPAFNIVTPQSDVDTAVGNAVTGKNLVACVAMDYSITPGVNNGLPFVRFLIFGPSGQLLSSVNLDGRREKFVPGTCVVCHGGDHYAGKFPEDGSGPANVGGHFLPYDTGNFEFSSQAGLREADQEQAIYRLNQNVLNAGPTPAEQELVAGWYANGQVLDKNYVPASWRGLDANSISFYQNVLARSCRSCHVAMAEPYNFDHYANITPGISTDRLADTGFDVGITACGGSGQVMRDHTMPNSLVTFNRFWQTYQNTVGQPDQPTILSVFFGADTGNTGTCVPGIQP